jgi:hypothetical protein
MRNKEENAETWGELLSLERQEVWLVEGAQRREGCVRPPRGIQVMHESFQKSQTDWLNRLITFSWAQFSLTFNHLLYRGLSLPSKFVISFSRLFRAFFFFF